MDELKLIEQAKQGDSDAFYHLICKHKNQMYKIAYSYFKNEQDALEAIQETVYRAFNNLTKLKQQQYFKTWLLRILINYCIDENKRKNKSAALVHSESANQNDNIHERIELDQAIAKLNSKYRSIILLKYFEDLTIDDIAFVMKKPVGTIKTWLNKALVELRIDLREEEPARAIQERKEAIGAKELL
ncbi:MAG: polymerase ECF-type sigma factor [Clostridia bacterium]|nr:polymerase ECF-type sigma factor [Clostridia bacterium]